MRSIDRKLLKASSAGSLRDVERLLKRGADANAADSSGWTPLYAASSWGHDDVVRIIYGLVVDWWRTSIVRGPGKVFAARIGAVKFPKNAGRYCNMMPIMLPTLREWRDATRDERPWVATIPDEFKAYIPLIEACPLTEADEGEIGYLTVDERATEADGQPQRRGRGPQTAARPEGQRARPRRPSWGVSAAASGIWQKPDIHRYGRYRVVPTPYFAPHDFTYRLPSVMGHTSFLFSCMGALGLPIHAQTHQKHVGPTPARDSNDVARAHHSTSSRAARPQPLRRALCGNGRQAHLRLPDPVRGALPEAVPEGLKCVPAC